MIRSIVKDAPVVWNNLNGVVNVFKPAGIGVTNVKSAMLVNLVKDLNNLKTRPQRKRVVIDKSQQSDNYDLSVLPDWSDHVLAIGPRYRVEDFKVSASHLGRLTSGVLLVGLNKGTYEMYKIRNNRALRVYHVTGELGTSTENNFKDSKIIARANYTHVWPDKMTAVLSSMQASHQKKMFEMCGVDVQSAAAFDIAKQGLIRPTDNRVPVIYGMKCVRFDRPEFVIEVHAINEREQYLTDLIQEVGLQLHSVAHCTGIRCIRHGHFAIENSLLRGQWNLQEIVSNMESCRKIIKEHPSSIYQNSIQLTEE